MSEGKVLRDKGIDLVKEHQQDAWKERYRNVAELFILTLPVGHTFLGEDVRMYANRHGVGQPTHPNAWGAMFRSFVLKELKAGRIEVYGMDHLKDPVGHASLARQYKKVL